MKYEIFSILFLAILHPTAPAVAMEFETLDEIDAEKRDLRRRETKLKERLRDIELVSQRVGYLRHFQNKFLYGKEGLTHRTQRWLGRAQRWLEEWEDVTDMAARMDAETAASSASEIEWLMRDMEDELATLRSSARRIHDDISAKRNELAEKKPLPPALVEGYNSHIKALNGQHHSLKRLTKELGRRFHHSSIDQFSRDVEAVRRAVVARLKTILLDYPELEDALTRANKALELATEIAPRVRELEIEATRVTGMYERYQVFAADDDFDALHDKAAGVREAIAGITEDPSLARPDLARVEETLRKVEAVRASAHQKPQKHAFLDFVDRMRRQLSRDCRRKRRAHLRDCDYLRTLNRVELDSVDDLDGWSPEDMAHFEAQLAAVEKGPSFTRRSPETATKGSGDTP